MQQTASNSLLLLDMFFYWVACQVTDAGLAHRKGLKKLDTLVLTNTRVTKAGLVQLKGLTRLESQSLDFAKSKEALQYLQTLRRQ